MEINPEFDPIPIEPDKYETPTKEQTRRALEDERWQEVKIDEEKENK